ncbi:hypothetical protein NDU88_007248 [Pleurodeles waltl]|uniref:Uncharacterized protein n=1 Tax=Pleurodeles waltl TaxID=8319 RepID=A0AAV7QK97_PLEWA|nr:hypothetical protein NDU88_007248 [Pleurodeles waltl]
MDGTGQQTGRTRVGRAMHKQQTDGPIPNSLPLGSWKVTISEVDTKQLNAIDSELTSAPKSPITGTGLGNPGSMIEDVPDTMLTPEMGDGTGSLVKYTAECCVIIYWRY